MKKIGIAIKPTISGNFQPVMINSGEWARKIRDIRPALTKVPAMVSDHHLIATLFFFGEDGCYIVVARTITNIDLENVSGWIYIPFDLMISGEEVVAIINQMKQFVAQPEMPTKETLERLFGKKTYPIRGMAKKFIVSPRNGSYAKKTIGQQSLAALFKAPIYSPVYNGYEAILLEEFPGEVVGIPEVPATPNQKPGTGQRSVIPPKPVISQPRRDRDNPYKSHPDLATTTQDAAAKKEGTKSERETYASKKDESNDDTFGIPDAPEEGPRKYIIGFICGLAVGIAIGIMIMVLINSGKNKEANNSAAETTKEAIIEEIGVNGDTTTQIEEVVATPATPQTLPGDTTKTTSKAKGNKGKNNKKTSRYGSSSYNPSNVKPRPSNSGNVTKPTGGDKTTNGGGGSTGGSGSVSGRGKINRNNGNDY